MTAPNPLHYGWWLAARASGIVALALVTVSVGVGLAMAGRVARRPGLAPRLMALHEHAALAGLVAIAVHGLTLLADPWLHLGVAGVTVPFAMRYRPGFTGMGVVAGYLAALLGLSFYARRRIGPRLWRRLHRATVLVYLLGVAHALGAGTDGSTRWLQTFVLATGAPIAVLFVRRTMTVLGHAACVRADRRARREGRAQQREALACGRPRGRHRAPRDRPGGPIRARSRHPRPTRPVRFDSQAMRALVVRACGDCHTHETKWRWYASVAPRPGSFSTTSTAGARP